MERDDHDTRTLMGLEQDRTPLGMTCPACSVTTVSPFCPGCGFVIIDPQAPREVDWPEIGDVLQLENGDVELRSALPSIRNARRFLATTEDDRLEAFVVAADDPDEALTTREERRRILGDLGLPTWDLVEGDGLLVELVSVGDTPTVLEGLTALLATEEPVDPLELVETWIMPVAHAVATCHEQGWFFGGLEPAEIMIVDGTCKFRDPPQAHRVDTPPPMKTRPALTGFSAPEVAGHCTGDLTPATDVFVIGLLLYYFLARTTPHSEAGLPQERLPPPIVFCDDLPPDLVAVARRATSPLPWRRYRDGISLLTALEIALHRTRERREAPHQPLSLDIGHELHIGVLKGQFAPINQDDMFLAWHGDSRIGLFLISDGVSISRYGSGDIASSCVRQAATEMWQSLVSGRFGPRQGDRPVLPETDGERRALLVGLLDRANVLVADRIHMEMPRFEPPPDGIMAATCVAALVDGNRLTLVSIGDSRIYLTRDHHISTLMADHDLATQLIRSGRPITTARAAPAAAALVRCVGEFDKDGARLIPVPLRPELRELTALPGDTFVLCSDGIPDYGGIDEEDAEERMRESVATAGGAPWAAFELMVLANRGGGGDNISCIVLNFGTLVEAL